MLDLKFIRENSNLVSAACKNKNVEVSITKFLELDGQQHQLQLSLEDLNRERNLAAKVKAIERGRDLKAQAVVLEQQVNSLKQQLQEMLFKIPNIPSDDTPVGKDENENVVLRQVGEPRSFGFKPVDHVEIGATLNMIDNERAAKVAGARFNYLKGDLALLQQALINYGISLLISPKFIKQIITENNLNLKPTPFKLIIPPLLIKTETYQRMARLDPADDRYHLPSDDLWLIGSAEHSLGPIFMDETLRSIDLPIRYMAITPAFRREAGSYGKDTQGILRQHQFDKLEMEVFSNSETGRAEQNLLVAIQEYIVKSLNIPYQIVITCTGDMGGPDARHLDLECWLPGQNKYRETHSADFMTDYQARRLHTKIRQADGQSHEFVHMNDATAVALGRTLIAIMENHQNIDRSVNIPEVLWPFMPNGIKILGKD